MGGGKKVVTFIIWAIALLLLLFGGFIVFGLIVHKTDFSDQYQTVVRVFTFIDWFILGLIVAIEIASLFFDRDALWSTAFLAIFITLAFSCSSDAVRIYFGGLPDRWISQIFASLYFFFSTLATISIYQFIVHEHRIKVTQREYIIVYVFLAVCAITYWPMSQLYLEFIPFIGLLLFIIYVSIKMFFHLRFSNANPYPTIAVYIISALELNTGLAYVLSSTTHLSYSTYGLPSFLSLLMAVAFISVYLNFVYLTTRKAYKAEKVEQTLKTLQSSVLKEQIAPHFLFNSLQSVKTNYRISQDKGDKAIDLLSKHLRNYVDSGDKFTVPFSKELDSVMTFVELANIRTDRPFNIIFDIDIEDFEVPTLSIESLIENAILYSCVNEKEDGYIEISSFEEGENIIVRIRDNGKGFDVKDIREGAVGIKNAFERFRLLLNGESKLESEIGQGTTITVRIPKSIKGGVENESDRS